MKEETPASLRRQGDPPGWTPKVLVEGVVQAQEARLLAEDGQLLLREKGPGTGGSGRFLDKFTSRFSETRMLARLAGPLVLFLSPPASLVELPA